MSNTADTADALSSTRDNEFIRIMRGQLGQNGMSVLTNLGFYFIAYLFIIVVMLIMFMTTYKVGEGVNIINEDAIKVDL